MIEKTHIDGERVLIVKKGSKRDVIPLKGPNCVKEQKETVGFLFVK
jgi:hypothetical protein